MANVDAMITVSGMPKDSLVFLVEGIHGPPSECNVRFQFTRVRRQISVLPSPSRGDGLGARPDAVPGRGPKVGVLSRMFRPLQDVWRNVGLGEVRHRIAARFEEQDDVLTVRDPASPEPHAHPPPQPFGK